MRRHQALPSLTTAAQEYTTTTAYHVEVECVNGSTSPCTVAAPAHSGSIYCCLWTCGTSQQYAREGRMGATDTLFFRLQSSSRVNVRETIRDEGVVGGVHPFSTMTRFHIHCVYYLLQKLMRGIQIVKTVVINLVTSIDAC
ncbi:hypothetical protein E2C01_028603 [Portunus trituberculatus]|uniref:Uncharacterized protein n=1 Tax=Portunus trituberculatus TaxID=210409 RepID=A0A5B7EP73_PORTR|nr:hypothetical protein [Portunus trituberculatus]